MIYLIKRGKSYSYSNICFKNKKDLFYSFNTNWRKKILFSKEYKINYKLTVEQEEALIGIMLGGILNEQSLLILQDYVLNKLTLKKKIIY